MAWTGTRMNFGWRVLSEQSVLSLWFCNFLESLVYIVNKSSLITLRCFDSLFLAHCIEVFDTLFSHTILQLVLFELIDIGLRTTELSWHFSTPSSGCCATWILIFVFRALFLFFFWLVVRLLWFRCLLLARFVGFTILFRAPFDYIIPAAITLIKVVILLLFLISILCPLALTLLLILLSILGKLLPPLPMLISYLLYLLLLGVTNVVIIIGVAAPVKVPVRVAVTQLFFFLLF